MIPVDMPLMLLGYMIYIFSEVFLWLFIAGLIALLIPRSRRYMVARRWRFGLLLMLLAGGSVPYIESTNSLWQDWRSHNPRLKHEEVLGDLVLPAGTQVHLQNLEPFNDLSGDPVPYGMQSLDHADFDRTPGNIIGMPVRRLKLAQGHGFATVETLSAHDLAGWKCAPGEVEFRFPFGAHFMFSKWKMHQCTLAPGTELGGIVWPGPVEVFSNTTGWEARSEQSPVKLLGIELRSLSMMLDRPYGDGRWWRGSANQPFNFGAIHYPADIQVSFDQGQMLFSLPPDAQAQDRRTGTLIEGGQTVVQSMAGGVLGIRTNDSMGVYFPDELIVR
ncbi:hypothetical protein QQ994_16125 [Pseudomonas asiatica]|uniref:hypothetical protein n=1 Tax=Pseudomonas TaxID=286 RepID=UPI0025712BB8|nr:MULTISPECIES: hypothetical protein [Pseudomonas]MDV5098990.1 hypothetical protein [Pseudomonas sp. LSJ-87]WJD68158.1 hypothetical protein QQ994_16125 [Pseudomonas asiatica]